MIGIIKKKDTSSREGISQWSKDWKVRRKSRAQKSMQKVAILCYLINQLMTETMSMDAKFRNSVTKSANTTALSNNILNAQI